MWPLTIPPCASLVSAASGQLNSLGIMPPIQQKFITLIVIMNDMVASTFHLMGFGIFLLIITRLASPANNRKHKILVTYEREMDFSYKNFRGNWS